MGSKGGCLTERARFLAAHLRRECHWWTFVGKGRCARGGRGQSRRRVAGEGPISISLKGLGELVDENFLGALTRWP